MDVRGHAKCVRSRWPTSLKWTMASRNPDGSNWMLEAMPNHAKCVRSRWPTSLKWALISMDSDTFELTQGCFQMLMIHGMQSLTSVQFTSLL
ncbi:hypothetical protein EMCRGX_G033538 [Ephydatia muelleri]